MTTIKYLNPVETCLPNFFDRIPLFDLRLHGIFSIEFDKNFLIPFELPGHISLSSAKFATFVIGYLNLEYGKSSL